jgi:NAD(P)-dependent dehydrogenase (short-subunit alcohol dehydrogenase family)
MMKRHEGKVAVISGAASGIGQASAIRLAQEGAEIIIADRDKAEKTLQLIGAFVGKANAFQCDVTNPESVDSLKAAIEAAGAGSST